MARLPVTVVPPKAEVNSEHWWLCSQLLLLDAIAVDVIRAPIPEPRIMRYELSDYEWTAIKPMLPNNVGVSRHDTTNSQPTIWCSSNSHQSEFGYAQMSPRPNTTLADC
jgi:hypothetical protein